MADYAFTTQPLPDGEVRLEWSADGIFDPLNFWIVASCDVDEAKRIIANGEFETQDGSTIPATVALSQAALTPK